MSLQIGDIVYIKERDQSTFYGWFKKKRGLGIIQNLLEGYSCTCIFWVKIVLPEYKEKTFTFYKEDLTKVDLNKLTQKEYDAIMVELL